MRHVECRKIFLHQSIGQTTRAIAHATKRGVVGHAQGGAVRDGREREAKKNDEVCTAGSHGVRGTDGAYLISKRVVVACFCVLPRK